ncbi:MAG: hypothetical protein WCK76_05390 [Elusimicrobiota bacterium]
MKKLVLILAAVIAFSGAAEARWWIFGKSAADFGLKYLYINGLPADETGKDIKLFQETLPPGGAVKINGRASSATVGSVRLTLDGKGTWQDVKFADNGTFEYFFKPETGKKYTLLIEITDTAGKTNNIEDTRKEIELSSENMQAKVRAALDTLFDSYNRENLRAFMAGVGENFAGDKAILERAVKRDFDALSNIVMRYTVNNVAAGAQGRVFVSISYSRMVFINKTGASNTDSGSTEFVFDSTEGKLSLFSMKQPLMFGLSDAENVATGEVLGNTAPNLVINDTGDLGGGILTKSVTCSGSGTTLHCLYYFSTGEKGCHPQTDMGEKGAIGEFLIYNTAAELHDLQIKTFNKGLASLTATEVRDLAGYSSSNPYTATVSAGYSYGIRKPATGEFWGIEFISLPAASGAQDTTFRVKSF